MARTQDSPQLPPSGTWFAPAERAPDKLVRSMAENLKNQDG